jgi:hypothetical protein
MQPRIDNRDWSTLSLGERIRQLEVEGYLVIPNLLSEKQISQLKAQTKTFDTFGTDYSDKQRGKKDVQWEGGPTTDLIAQPQMIEFLHTMFGSEIILMSYVYARSEPGHPGISLHTDGQPYGSEIFGYEGSCPFLIRVLYYLDDLTPEVSPFRVVPYSHLCMHEDANPYKRYEAHPEEVMVPVKAGGAVLINHRVFHGNFPNTGDRAREMLAIAYRPGWAGPIAEVKEWDAEKINSLPEAVRVLCASRNTRRWDFGGANKPANMKREAPGMNPSRWEQA